MKAWIEKIVLEGFKSYGKERVEIPLGEGFIGIVGPNGAGKSNIGDAISFALGIATAKTLRAKNLSYLIYNRNSERADYAYVEVHFKNYGLFPVQEEDIVISRKVFQDGRTVFRINGVVVRERDLKEFLSKAGIYESAYNVVLQGDVIRFLKMTPIERRKLIEDIAGIEEYEEKKQKALADLGEVELKIRELRLLMDEMEVQMERLKGDLERLKLYRNLEERRRSLEIKLGLKAVYELKRSLSEIEEKVKLKEKELEEVRQSIAFYEERLASIEEELRKVSEELFPFRERVGRISQSLENIDQVLQTHRKRLDDIEKEIHLTEDQIRFLEVQREELEREGEGLKGSIDQERMDLVSLEECANSLLKSIKEREEELKVSLEEMERTEEKIKELNSLLDSRKRERAELEIRARELDMKMEKVREDMERLKEEKERIRRDMEEALMSRENYQSMLEEERRTIKSKREELQRVEEDLKRIRGEKEEVLKEMSMIKGKLEGLPPEDLPFEGIGGVYGKVSSLIRVKEMEHLKAVEVAGGARLSYVVVEDEEVAKECIKRLKELRWGRLNFIPLNRIRDTKTPSYYHLPRIKGVIDFVVNLVDYDRKFEKAVKFVFGDTLLVESFETAKMLGIGVYRMVTLEGDLFEKSGVISGGYDEERGQLGRAFYLEKLEELNRMYEKLVEEEERREKLLKTLREDLVEKEGALAILQRRLEEMEEKNRSRFEKIRSVEERLQRAQEYIGILEGERIKVRERLRELEEEVQYLEEKIENLSLKRQSFLLHYKESGVEELRWQYEKLRQRMEKLRESIHTKQIKLKEIELEKEDLQREVGRKRAFIENAKMEMESLKNQLEDLLQKKEKLQEELQSINLQAYELYKKKDRLEEDQRKVQSELGRLKLYEENLKEELHRLNLERTRLEERYSEGLERLKALEYEGDIVEVKESVGRLKEELSKVLKELSSLGSINFKAEEEYKEYEERYKDYQERYRRLKEEKEAIRELIEEIEKKKLKAFMETFHAINRNLKGIFSQLSPGGKAYMMLEKEDDPFSGGIHMVVKPKGKEVQYLEAISGGEKTLAALSLIFAIQDYRPSPFYYFDEVDAHLDEVNARRVGELIKERSKNAQFIVVTLREVLASFADKIIGVSGRGGLSKVFTLENPSITLTG